MIIFNEIIERLKQYTGLKANKDVAELFGISAPDFSRRKKQGTLLPLIVEWGINNNVNLDWLLAGKELEPPEKLPSTPNIIELEHSDLIKDFKDKRFAKEINVDLLEIERIDPAKFRETGFYVKGVASTLKSIKQDTEGEPNAVRNGTADRKNSAK